MELEQLAIEVRERKGWSAIDLGFALARQWWRGLFLSWLLPALATFTLFHLVLYKYPGIAMLLTWWLKPLYDRFPLYILSKRLFGEEVPVSTCLRNWRRVCACDPLPWLLWRRFNPLRSFVLPVTVLEGLRSKARQRRVGTLEMRASIYAMWLTTICIHIETLLVLATLFAVFLLVPPQIDMDLFSLIAEREGALLYGGNLLSLLAMALVAPFYVSGGFMLYINRRIELEAWDIELAFRALAARLHKLSLSVIAGLVFAMAFAGAAPTVLASEGDMSQSAVAQATIEPNSIGLEQPTTDPAFTAAYAQEQISAVLDGEAFHQVVTIAEWRWKHADENEAEGTIPEWIIRLVEILGKLWPDWDGDTASTLETIAWLLRAAVIAILLYLFTRFFLQYRSTLGRWFGLDESSTGEDVAPPQRLFGMAVSQESLPGDIPAEVTGLWGRGERRAALALLYRGALSQFLHRYEVPFTEALTELECAELVAARSESRYSQYFRDMTRGWMQLAYGHIEPEQLWVELQCERWRELFDSE